MFSLSELDQKRRTLGLISLAAYIGTIFAANWAIARYGIRSILPENVELISGPGCPVCVTDTGYIDAAIKLAKRGLIIASFGDMLKVPGSSATLAQCRSEGAQIEICYSPLQALELAAESPDQEVVFLAIGFETTIGPVVSIVQKALAENVKNVSSSAGRRGHKTKLRRLPRHDHRGSKRRTHRGSRCPLRD